MAYYFPSNGKNGVVFWEGGPSSPKYIFPEPPSPKHKEKAFFVTPDFARRLGIETSPSPRPSTPSGAIPSKYPPLCSLPHLHQGQFRPIEVKICSIYDGELKKKKRTYPMITGALTYMLDPLILLASDARCRNCSHGLWCTDYHSILLKVEHTGHSHMEAIEDHFQYQVQQGM